MPGRTRSAIRQKAQHSTSADTPVPGVQNCHGQIIRSEHGRGWRSDLHAQVLRNSRSEFRLTPPGRTLTSLAVYGICYGIPVSCRGCRRRSVPVRSGSSQFAHWALPPTGDVVSMNRFSDNLAGPCFLVAVITS